MAVSTALWHPDASSIKEAHLTHYSQWLRRTYHVSFGDYHALWQWSAAHPEDFWESIWRYFKVKSNTPYKKVISKASMPYTRWFEGATLNYAEHIFRNKTAKRPALIFASERQKPIEISWDTFEEQTAALQSFLKQRGVSVGDRIVAYIPNIPEASIALLATISLGAIWSSCAPDFGMESVMDRFRQIRPKVLIAADGYIYNGKPYDRMEVIGRIKSALPSIETVIIIPYLNEEADATRITSGMSWKQILDMKHGDLSFVSVPFSHPIWVLYSSGTTGLPKAITHSHGGMLLEHLKYMALHNDVKEGERFFWFSTTGWMMWNFVQASLLAGAVMVLYDGSPGYPDLNVLWRLAEDIGIHHFGTSAPFLVACMKKKLRPGMHFNLSALRTIGSTGAPLPPEGFEYVYENIKKNLWLCSMSGGTDVCTAWVGSCVLRPVFAGEIQCRCLGASMYAYDAEGEKVENEVGEMVITKPMPCMPVYLWNDPDFKGYQSAYFEKYPGIWRHGDWIRITPHDGVVISGRSDATLNRKGVRIGTAGIYRAIHKLSEIKESLIVNIELPGGKDYMPLFVVLQEENKLTDSLKEQINQVLRNTYSPRHVPDAIFAAPDIPYTLSGKKMEAPVKNILLGKPVEQSIQRDAIKNPEALDYYIDFAHSLSDIISRR